MSKCRFLYILVAALLSHWATATSAAPKTDIVILKNGDRFTGELKSLNRGQLNFNTEATGTIGIEWNKVATVVSKQRIQVEVSSGIRYFGTLAPQDSNLPGVVVTTDAGPQILETMNVIEMTPIEGVGIHALKVGLSVGYDYAKAGGVKNASLGLDLDYRSLIRIESIRFSTVITDSNSQDANRRTNLHLQHTRLWNRRWFQNTNLSFDQNDELGLKLRSSVGVGGGRFLLQSNTMLLSMDGSLQFSREDLVSEDDDTDSLEATFSVNWDWFLFDDPELDWSTRIQIIPSLTEHGRVRGELDTTLSWEVFGDLKWAFSLYGSWDNQPQSATAATSDYGVNTALSYDF